MQPSAFLSIDLDFWQLHKDSKYFIDVLNKVFSIKNKVNIYLEHEEMLGDVNISKSRILINIDYHDDYRMSCNEELNCSNWVDYVTWKKDGHYIWISPYDGLYLQKEIHKPDKWMKNETFFRPMRILNKYNIENCSICISPDHFMYYENCVYKLFGDIYKKNIDKIICTSNAHEEISRMYDIYKSEIEYSRKRSNCS